MARCFAAFFAFFVLSTPNGVCAVQNEAVHAKDARSASLVFFSIVNQTSGSVEVTLIADGNRLFTRRLDHQPGGSALQSGRQKSQSSAREMKVTLPDQTEVLDVQVMPSGKEKKFNISGFRRSAAGFRIVVRDNDILLTQDYYPIR
jgi:hypothetical protein